VVSVDPAGSHDQSFDQPSQAYYPPERDADGSIDGLSKIPQSVWLSAWRARSVMIKALMME
jgi:hypothetical protein